MSRGRTASPPLGNIAKAAVSPSGVTSPVPSDSDGTFGRSRKARIGRPGCITCRAPTRCCSTVAARLLDSISAARSVNASGRLVADVAGAHSSGPCGRIESRPSRMRHRGESLLERGGKQERLECRTGLTAAAGRAVECRPLVVAAPDERQDVAGVRIDRHERRLQLGLAETPSPSSTARSAASCNACDNRRVHAPVRRMVPAEACRENADEGSPWRTRGAPSLVDCDTAARA